MEIKNDTLHFFDPNYNGPTATINKIRFWPWEKKKILKFEDGQSLEINLKPLQCRATMLVDGVLTTEDPPNKLVTTAQYTFHRRSNPKTINVVTIYPDKMLKNPTKK